MSGSNKIEKTAALISFATGILICWLGFLPVGIGFFIAALILYVQYDIKNEINRVMGVENKVRIQLVEEAATVREDLVAERALVKRNLRRNSEEDV